MSAVVDASQALLFLAASSRGVTKLRRAYREREALRGVGRDYAEQLAEDQREDLRKRLAEAERQAVETLGPTYVVALRVHRQGVEATTLTDARPTLDEHLEYLWTTLVEDEEWVFRRVGGVTLDKAGLVPKEGGDAGGGAATWALFESRRMTAPAHSGSAPMLHGASR